jgi:hypothetical protein
VAKTVALALLQTRPPQVHKAVEFLQHLTLFGVQPDVGLCISLLQVSICLQQQQQQQH